jgi:hypothetical protein
MGNRIHHLAAAGLELHRVTQALDPHLLDRQPTGIGSGLDIRQEKIVGCIHGSSSLGLGRGII